MLATSFSKNATGQVQADLQNRCWQLLIFRTKPLEIFVDCYQPRVSEKSLFDTKFKLGAVGPCGYERQNASLGGLLDPEAVQKPQARPDAQIIQIPFSPHRQ